MHAMTDSDRSFLRTAFTDLLVQLDHQDFSDQPRHGEPHAANLISTDEGVRWIDFEGACHGPLEWDLAHLDADVAEYCPGLNPSHLQLLRLLTSARVAVWCWARAEHANMRSHATHHLGVLRTTLA